MRAFPDTSYLCALYRRQANNQPAVDYLAALDEPLAITTLVHYEFVNGVRLEIFRHRAHHTRGYPEVEGLAMLAAFELQLERGILADTPFEAEAVVREAIRLSEAHTIRRGRAPSICYTWPLRWYLAHASFSVSMPTSVHSPKPKG